jgi:hypothetical protein
MKVNTMQRYTLENKPEFKYKDRVFVDMECFNMPDLGIIEGTIVGKAMTHIIDFWLIDFHRTFPLYEYPVVSVIHTAIIEEL